MCRLAAGEMVTHTVVVTNVGNAKLRDVMVTTTRTTNDGVNTVSGPTTYSCSLNSGGSTTLASPGVNLTKPGVLTCTATYTFATISTIEAGDLRFDTQVTAAGGATTQTGQKTVTVHQLPKLVVSSSSTGCADPNPNNEGQQGVAVGALASFRSACRICSAQFLLQPLALLLTGFVGPLISHCVVCA
jgi:hypothetical protein